MRTSPNAYASTAPAEQTGPEAFCSGAAYHSVPNVSASNWPFASVRFAHPKSITRMDFRSADSCTVQEQAPQHTARQMHTDRRRVRCGGSDLRAERAGDG